MFGAAAAAGRLLGLSPQRLSWALGIAATQASGLREMFGSMCKPYHVGHAGRNGLAAALMAQSGFTSSERGIEAPRGFANVLSTKQDYAQITDQLGTRFELGINSYKPFPCGVVIHPILDGCLRLKRAHNIAAADIAQIDLAVHPLVLELCGKKEPATDLEGRFSVYHSAAAATIRGRAGVDEYTDAAVNDPDIIGLRQRVTAAVRDGIEVDQTEVTMTLNDSQVLREFVEHAIGSKDNPMSDADIDAKTRDQCQPILGAAAVDDMISACRHILDLDSAAAIAAAATPN